MSWTTIRTLSAYLSLADKSFQIFNVSGQGYADMGGTGFMHISNDASEMIMPATGTSFPHSFSFLNADIGYAMKENQIMKTTDGGMDFNLIHTFTSITSDFNKWHVYFVDQSTGFVCGRNGKIYKMDGTTSVSKTSIKSLFKIFPNPANEIIQLDYENNLQVHSIQLVDIAGKLIRTFHKNEKKLNIAGLSKGFYLLNIQTKEGTVSEKMIVN